MRKQSAESPVQFAGLTPDPHIGEDATHPQGVDLTVMNYINHQPVPVYSSDTQPIMPANPARARKLLQRGRAVPHHVKGLFGIRLLDRTRAQSVVQDVAINIDPGSQTTGIAVVADDENGQRTVLAALEIKHRAFNIKATLTKRRSFRRNRRARLRFRKPRFDNRRRKQGTLPPSVDSLRADTMRLVNILRRMYPISSIRLERNKFDPQMMMNPDVKGVEYQRGTLFGWQVRAYILERDQGRCTYCRRRDVQLELDHVRPRATGSDRVDNLVACCRDCNIKKANQPIEQFLADQPELLQRILTRLNNSALASAAQINAGATSTHQRTAGHQATSATYRRRISVVGTPATQRPQDSLLRRRLAGARLPDHRKPAQPSARDTAHQRPLQAEGQRGPPRHSSRTTFPQPTETAQASEAIRSCGRPLRPTPTLQSPEYRHRRHHRPRPQGGPIHRPGRHQSQGHTSRSRQTECQHRQWPNHRPQSTTPHPLDHAIPTGTSRPRRRYAFGSRSRLINLKSVTHAKANRAQCPYLNNPTVGGRQR